MFQKATPPCRRSARTKKRCTGHSRCRCCGQRRCRHLSTWFQKEWTPLNMRLPQRDKVSWPQEEKVAGVSCRSDGFSHLKPCSFPVYAGTKGYVPCLRGCPRNDFPLCLDVYGRSDAE